MYECPVQKMLAPLHDEMDEAHRSIAAKAAAWVKPLLEELSQSLPGRRLEYGDEVASMLLPGVLVTPPVVHDGQRLGLLEDIVEQAPGMFRDPERVRQIDDMLRDAGIKVCDRFGGIGDVVCDPDEAIN